MAIIGCYLHETEVPSMLQHSCSSVPSLQLVAEALLDVVCFLQVPNTWHPANLVMALRAWECTVSSSGAGHDTAFKLV